MSLSSACEPLDPLVDLADPRTRFRRWRTEILMMNTAEMGEYLDGNSFTLVCLIEAGKRTPGRRANPKSRSRKPLAEVVAEKSRRHAKRARKLGFKLPILPHEWP